MKKVDGQGSGWRHGDCAGPLRDGLASHVHGTGVHVGHGHNERSHHNGVLVLQDVAVVDVTPVIIGPARAGTVTTETVRAVLRATITPTAAVYVAWDARGRCRYVGSIRRPQSRAAVRDRLSEHLAAGDPRKAEWYALTVTPYGATWTSRRCASVRGGSRTGSTRPTGRLTR
jgi:hypothetical protein